MKPYPKMPEDHAFALRGQLRASAQELADGGAEGSWIQIGRHAWNRLTPTQREEALPTLLATYLHRVMCESIDAINDEELTAA